MDSSTSSGNYNSLVEIPARPDEDFDLVEDKVFAIVSSSTKFNWNDDDILPVRYFPQLRYLVVGIFMVREGQNL